MFLLLVVVQQLIKDSDMRWVQYLHPMFLDFPLYESPITFIFYIMGIPEPDQ